jgi:hypothetical protein
MIKHHGIKVGDLVRFKHHIFDEHKPVHLVAEIAGSIAPVTKEGMGTPVPMVRILNHRGPNLRADSLIVVSRS